MASEFNNTMPSEPPKVKCAECGFLALRMRMSRELVETELWFRINGRCPIPARANEFEATPVCFVRAMDIASECGDRSPEGVAAGLNRTRDCKQFTPWHQGSSPKEHQESRDRDAADRDARKWREEQATKDHDWRQQDAATANRRHRQNLIVAIVGVIVALVVGILTAIAAMPAAK